MISLFFSFTDTNQRLDMSVESLNNMRQECESLREELRVLSEKLLKQHDAALESQVCRSYSLVGRIRTVIYPHFSLF